MNLRTRRVFALAFSILVVTATLTPATAALEPASQDRFGGLFEDYGILLSGHDDSDNGQGNGNGNGNKGGNSPNRTTTASQPPATTTTTSPGDNNTTTTTGPPRNGNSSQGPPNGSEGPPNRSNGPPNGSEGPPEDPGGGPPENPGGGPPENPGGGPPPWAGGNGGDDRGPPEWVKNSQTPPRLDGNRSALGNNSSVFRNASINVTVAENASAVDYRLAAIDALQDADFDGPGRSADQHRIEALRALDDSLPYVLDANRTTAAQLFELDKKASTPPQFAPNVTKLLVRSDQQLAETAIADAEGVATILQARNVSFDETAVRENITEAKAAYARADRFRTHGQHHTAISQYRVAWIHAQQALDVLDLATTPNVTITTHEDMPHEGNVTYTVRGRVFDVRGHELELVLSLNGENRTVPLSVNTTPGTVGTFEENVTLTQQVNRIEVTATDPNRRWSPEYGDENATTGRDLLWLDADGLPDYYELNVTGTDPLAPDSNATATPSNESDNVITDGAEDFDSDGETAYDAYRFGTDPLDNDTDGDGLLDGFELQFRGMDPLEVHTDNDSVADSAEDPDNDTLANLREQNASTSPVRNDTDRDTLNDSAELANGTDPLARDTDNDGLADPDEYEVGTDPTVADTDGDGVLDGNETFSTTTTNESVGAAVNVSGEGNVAETISIENESNEQIQTETVLNASASEVLSFEADVEFEQANLSIEYDETAVGDEADVAVYTYNETQQTYVKLPSEVDAANDTVTGTTPHFSTFVAMNETAWKQYLQSPAKPAPNYVLKESFGNLSGWNCTGDCAVGDGQVVVGQDDAAFAEEVSTNCQGPYLPDGSCPEQGDDDDSGDDDGGSDDGSDGGETGGSGDDDLCYYIERCPGHGDDDEDTTTTTTTTTTTDDDPQNGGGSSDPPPQLGAAELERSVSIPADAVQVNVTGLVSAFAEEGNASVEVAVSVGGETRTVVDLDGQDGERVHGGAYVDETFESPSGEQVTFWVRTENLSGASVDYVDIELKRDSDGDGLTNRLERHGIKTGDGDRVDTNPYDADTDGDGLSDGEEVAGHIPRYVDGGFFELESDPTEADSDHDGLDDYEEQRIWGTDPQDSDTEDDGFLDSADPRPLVEDNPPSASDIQSDNYKKYVKLSVEDETAVSVEGNPKYDPAKPLEDSFWNTSMATVTDGSDGEYHIEFDGHGKLGEPPERYWVNLTDAHGNERKIEIEVNDGGGAELAATGVVVGGAVASPNEPTLVGSALVGGVIMGVSAGGLYLVNEYVAADGKTVKNQPATGVEAHYPASETVLETTVTLPTGTVATGTDPRTGETVARGHGWQYIAETTGLTQAEIEQVVRDDASTVYEHGNGVYTVIGRATYLDRVVISIVGGTIMMASTDTFAEDPCGEGQVELESAEEHYTRKKDGEPDKPVDSRSELKQLIENGELIKALEYTTTGNRYYIIKVGPEQYTLLFLEAVSNLGGAKKVWGWLKAASYRMKTIFTDRINNNQYFDSAEEAEDAARRYKDDPLKEVDC